MASTKKSTAKRKPTKGQVAANKAIDFIESLKHSKDPWAGKPFKLAQPEGKLTKEYLEASADNIMKHIAELLPKEYRGVYSDS